MYKDKDKQREAARAAKLRFRAKNAGKPKTETLQDAPGSTNPAPRVFQQGIPDEGIPGQGIPAYKRGAEIRRFEDLPLDVQADIERDSRACEVDGVKFTQDQDRQARTARAIKYQHLFPGRYHSLGIERVPASFKVLGYLPADELAPGQYNRVAKPGDPDYQGVCVKVGDT